MKLQQLIGDAVDHITNFLGLQERASAPGTITNVGQVWVDTSQQLHYLDSMGVDQVIAGSDAPSFKSYTAANFGNSGIHYIGGYYDAPAADANLTQVGATVNLGSAGVSYAAHAFLVAGGAGSVDAGAASIVVSGTSITDAGVRTPADSETIVADITAMSTNEYFETSKKWLGTVTYTLTPAGAAVYSADFNYGWCKYEDFGNRDFTVTDFEVVGEGGASETTLDIELLKHQATGWTYDAAAFVPGSTAIIDLATDHSTDNNLVANNGFAYKRAGLSEAVSGSASEGLVVRISTAINNSIEYASAHIGVRFT